MAKVTLANLEIRYANIRKVNPKVKKCSIRDCKNPRDSTELLGEDTSCAYHRLLFDYWIADVLDNDKVRHFLMNQRGRRRAFTNWMKRVGKKSCDKIVLRMMKEPINWKC